MIGCSFFLHIAQCTNFYWFYIELKSFLEEYSFSFNLPTGKWFSQALIFASTNPQYDKILFFESPVQYMKIPSSEHVVYTNCFFVFVLIFRTIYVHNMFWAWNCHVLNWWFKEQSVAILWVSWCKNKSFWQSFTCTVQECLEKCFRNDYVTDLPLVIVYNFILYNWFIFR